MAPCCSCRRIAAFAAPFKRNYRTTKGSRNGARFLPLLSPQRDESAATRARNKAPVSMYCSSDVDPVATCTKTRHRSVPREATPQQSSCFNPRRLWFQKAVSDSSWGVVDHPLLQAGRPFMVDRATQFYATRAQTASYRAASCS
jgi:hypothetical protein